MASLIRSCHAISGTEPRSSASRLLARLFRASQSQSSSVTQYCHIRSLSRKLHRSCYEHIRPFSHLPEPVQEILSYSTYRHCGAVQETSESVRAIAKRSTSLIVYPTGSAILNIFTNTKLVSVRISAQARRDPIFPRSKMSDAKDDVPTDQKVENLPTQDKDVLQGA